MMNNSNYTKDLLQRARKLSSAVESLASLFEQENSRSIRKDQVDRLKILQSSILEKVKRVKAEETSSSLAYNRAPAVGSWTGLFMELITMNSEHRTMQAISRQLLSGSGEKKPPFGTTLICIGSRGIPDDVDVVNISRLARNSNEDEWQTKNKLVREGYLLFTTEGFTPFIDKFTDGILKGEISLPVSIQRVRDMLQMPIRLLNGK